MPNTGRSDIPPQILQEIERALRDIQFGSIEITMHEGRITQIERREKVRLASGGRSAVSHPARASA